MSYPPDEDLPPPYSPTTTNTTSSSIANPLSPSLYTSHIASHLSTLPARIRATQSQHTTQQAADDLDLITLLTPHIEAFLSDLAAHPRSPPSAELTLVPAAAVPQPWTLSGARERRREGEVVQLVRVVGPEAQSEKERDAKAGGGSGARSREAAASDGWDDGGGSGGESSSGESSTPGSWWWWRDEDMARRLAAYLQPRPKVKTERRQIQAAVETAREEKKKGWGWGRRKAGSVSGGGSASVGAATVPPPALVHGKDSEKGAPKVDIASSGMDEDRVAMSVAPEEVAFRRENEFGVWESMSGFAIVVTVRIRRP